MVSPSSGAIFEKRIIEKYIQENGVDPISGKELTMEDLIEIKSELSPISIIKQFLTSFWYISTTNCETKTA